MRVAIVGRTNVLLAAAERVTDAGHTISAVVTCKPEKHYDAGVDHFKKLANDQNCAFAEIASLNSSDSISFLNGTKSDIAISVNWPKLIGTDARSEFRLGILNAHAGDLPLYRGNATPNWAILNGETRIGLCIHQMTDTLDAGDVLIRQLFDLTEETYISDVYDWIRAVTPEMFVSAINGLANQTISPTPQDQNPAKSLRCYPRLPEDGLIDWTAPRTMVHRIIRASSHPFHGAYSFLNGRKVTIWRASSLETAPFLSVPGHICERDGIFPIIACHDGMLRLEEVSIDEGVSNTAALKTISSSLRARMRSI